MASSSEMKIGDDIVIKVVQISALKEQDVNAQVMEDRHFERLTENIRIRGQVESLPYCHQPGEEGPISIISGHHRVRAARMAGLTEIPCIVDYRDMNRSEIVAKQIAHNELHGDPDEKVMSQLIAMIDSVDDLLMTGLDEDHLPVPEDDDTKLNLPHAEFDWRIVNFTFLPDSLATIEEALETIDKKSELIGVAPREDFQGFSENIIQYARLNGIKSLGTAVDVLLKLAITEIERIESENADQDDEE